MKKQLYVGIAAASLAAVMCVSFAACGEGSGAGEAKDMKGVEVTEEQWNAAFEAFDSDYFGGEMKYTIHLDTKEICTVQTDASATDGQKSGTFTATSAVTYVANGTKQSMEGEQTNSVEGDYAFADLVTALGSSPQYVKEGTTKSAQYLEKTNTGYTLYVQNDDGSWRSGPYSPVRSPILCPINDYEQYGDFD